MAEVFLVHALQSLRVMNAIHRLAGLGQSTWLDFIDHDLLASGKLEQLIKDGVAGVTSNPTIFQKAIKGSKAYDHLIRQAEKGSSPAEILETIMTLELEKACDVLRSVYERSDGRDGFASIEVEPTIAHDTQAQIDAAERLWRAVDRPNLMVKIPATEEGVPAVEAALAEGINVNVTLLFSLARYKEVIEAHLKALERRVADGKRVDFVASVASFFVSRVDTKVDKLLDAMPNSLRGAAGSLRGQIAIANAMMAYEEHERVLASDRWKALAAKGAQPQRLLWASTSSKDPTYPDTYYAEALVGTCTVDTMTLETIDAYKAKGKPESRLTLNRDVAKKQLEQLATLQINLDEVTAELEREGVESFSKSFHDSLDAIAQKRRRSAA